MQPQRLGGLVPATGWLGLLLLVWMLLVRELGMLLLRLLLGGCPLPAATSARRRRGTVSEPLVGQDAPRDGEVLGGLKDRSVA